MQKFLFQNHIITQPSAIHGYGVFATQPINAGEVIEECCTLPLNTEPNDFFNYKFNYKNRMFIALGYGSLYNHSDQPNAHFQFDMNTEILTFQALKDLQPGDEILVYYGEDWFNVHQIQVKHVKKRMLAFLNPLRSFSLRIIMTYAVFLSLLMVLAGIHFTK